MEIGIQAATSQAGILSVTVCRNWGPLPSGGTGCLCKTPAEMTQYHRNFQRDLGRVPASQQTQYEQQAADGLLDEASAFIEASLPAGQRLVGRSRTVSP